MKGRQHLLQILITLVLGVTSDYAQFQFQQLSTPIGGPVTGITSDGIKYYVGVNGSGVYQSADGVSWIALNLALGEPSVESVFALNGQLYVGTHHGVYQTDLVTTTRLRAASNDAAFASDTIFGIVAFQSGIMLAADDGVWQCSTTCKKVKTVYQARSITTLADGSVLV